MMWHPANQHSKTLWTPGQPDSACALPYLPISSSLSLSPFPWLYGPSLVSLSHLSLHFPGCMVSLSSLPLSSLSLISLSISLAVWSLSRLSLSRLSLSSLSPFPWLYGLSLVSPSLVSLSHLSLHFPGCMVTHTHTHTHHHSYKYTHTHLTNMPKTTHAYMHACT